MIPLILVLAAQLAQPLDCPPGTIRVVVMPDPRGLAVEHAQSGEVVVSPDYACLPAKLFVAPTKPKG